MSELPRLARRAAALLRDHAAQSARDALRAGRAAASGAWTRRPSGDRAAAIAFAAAVALAGAWSVVAQARLVRRLPSPVEWAAARALVDRDLRPGDAAAVAPAWAERARELLPASVPVLTQAPRAGEDLIGVRRVWLLSLPAAPWRGWATELALAGRASRAEPVARLGALEVTRYDLASPVVPLAFLPDRLGQASVTLGDAPCPAEGAGRFRCGDGAAELARTVREIAGAPRVCLSAAAPAPLDAAVEVTFPPMRIGRTLRGHAGGAAGAPVRVAVLLDGEEAGAVEVSGDWAPFQVDLAPGAGQTRSLSLAVTSPGRLALCLDAAVLP